MKGFASWAKPLSTVAVLATAWVAASAPPPDSAGSARTPDPQIQAVARDYSATMRQVIAQIEQLYVRPISSAALVEASVVGLFEAARLPVPTQLRRDIHQASDGELQAILMRAREALGDHDALRGPRALLVSLNSLSRALDPYCTLLGQKEFQALDQDERMPQTGLEFPLSPGPPSYVGLTHPDEGGRRNRLTIPAGPIRVTGVQPGSPAQKSGIRPGDLVIAVDDKPPEHPGFAAAFQRLLPVRAAVAVDSPALTSTIKLRLLRPGQSDQMDVSIVPATYRTESVFGARRRPDGSWDFLHDVDERIGYIRIGLIQSHSYSEFADALRSLKSPTLRGLILDLRWCPGGYLRPAASIARQLLGPDQVPIASQRDRFGRVLPVEFYAVETDSTDFPVVVLVNGETSGGGELIAAALQDHGRAVVAGMRTVGKFSVQEPLDRFGIPLKITTSTLLRPGKRSLGRVDSGPEIEQRKPADEWVVRPDRGYEIPCSMELSRQLKAGWVLQILRPAGSTEALLLDDPENDPQRQAAVQILRGLMGR
jgi:C-terminal peptidase prc